MAVPREEDGEAHRTEALSQRTVARNDPGAAALGELEHGVVPSAPRGQRREPLRKGTGRLRVDLPSLLEAFELAEHGRRHGEESPGAVAMNLGLEGEPDPTREEERVRVEQDERARAREGVATAS